MSRRAFIFARFDKILPYLYLTGVEGIDDDNVRTYNIKCIVNCAIECPPFQCDFSDVEVIHLPLHDTPEENISQHFDKCADKIEEIRQKGGSTVVHCFAGRSRSASIVLAYLMKYHKMNLKAAFEHIRTERDIRPNEGFFRQLIAYEEKLFGQTSVKMIKVKIKSTKLSVDGISNDNGEITIPDVYQNDFK